MSKTDVLKFLGRNVERMVENVWKYGVPGKLEELERR